MEGKTIEEILTNTKNKWLVTKKDKLTEIAKGSIGEVDIFVLDELTIKQKKSASTQSQVSSQEQSPPYFKTPPTEQSMLST